MVLIFLLSTLYKFKIDTVNNISPKNTDIKADIKSEITDFTERSDE